MSRPSGKAEKRIVRAAMAWFRSGGGFFYRGEICDNRIFNVVTRIGHANALEKACASYAKGKSK